MFCVSEIRGKEDLAPSVRKGILSDNENATPIQHQITGVSVKIIHQVIWYIDGFKKGFLVAARMYESRRSPYVDTIIS